MLVKITDAEESFVEALKARTGCTVASKAFLHAGLQYGSLLDQAACDRDRIAYLELEVMRLRYTIDGARESAQALLDATTPQPEGH